MCVCLKSGYGKEITFAEARPEKLLFSRVGRICLSFSTEGVFSKFFWEFSICVFNLHFSQYITHQNRPVCSAVTRVSTYEGG